ncbi:hypothetical protein ACFQY4_22035 [Catellatospora bangladeshensis]
MSGRYAVPDVPGFVDACDTVELKAVLPEGRAAGRPRHWASTWPRR